MKSDRLGHSSSSVGGLSGSNDDSSVVSLKALVAKVEPIGSAARSAKLEDSGLIDLKSLMAHAPPPSSNALPPVLAPAEAGLFAVPEATLSPYVQPSSSLPEEAKENTGSHHLKWIAVGTAMVLAIVGTIGVLGARSRQADRVEEGLAAATRSAATNPGTFVEPKPSVEAVAPVVETASAQEAPTVAAPALPRRKAAMNPSSRDRARTQEPANKAKPEVKAAPSTPCDLMCEIQRAAKKQKPQ